MKRRTFIQSFAGGAVMLTGSMPLNTSHPEAAASVPGSSDRIVVHPKDTGIGLVNPGMGWIFYNYDNNLGTYTVNLAPTDTVPEFPGVSTVYMRLDWSDLEPEEGEYNWPILDTPMQKWVQAGKRVAFRFCTSESNPSAPYAYATPPWVVKAGAKGFHLNAQGNIAKDGPIWEPDFDDPIFLEKVDHFLAAAAARFDGNPHVAFMDVGTYGVWGEGHPLSRKRYSFATIRRHFELYKKNFKCTPIIVNDDFIGQGGGMGTIGYARDQGMGYRDDSIMVLGGADAYFHAYLSYNFWPRVLVILESEHYGISKKHGFWGDGHLYLQAIEQYHASYAGVHWYPREFLAANRDLVDRINLRLGYRLQLLEASWPAEVTTGGPMAIGYSWRNTGVAPCLPGGHPAVTFEDEKGGIAGVFVDQEFYIRDLPVGPSGQAQIISRFKELKTLYEQENDQPLVTYNLPPSQILRPATYGVYISVGTATGEPMIALPLPGDDGHRRYRLGSINVLAGK